MKSMNGKNICILTSGAEHTNGDLHCTLEHLDYERDLLDQSKRTPGTSPGVHGKKKKAMAYDHVKLHWK